MAAWVSRKRSRIAAGQPGPSGGPSGPAFITGVSASTSTQAGYFTDQYSQPRLWVADWMEGLFTNAGRWNGSGGGTYQQDFDNYCSQRAAQGLTALYIEPVGALALGGVHDNGNTWDNVAPFNTGTDPTSGLNSTYWVRMDYLLSSAQANGITVMLLLDIEYCGNTGQCYAGWTGTQFQAYGAALGARYASRPNLIWVCGDDSFPTTFDSSFSSFLTGLSSAGDTHLVAALWMAEYTSRYATDTGTQASWGTSHSAFSDCYTYNCGYWCIEYAYGEVANQGASALLPPVWGNGYHYQGGTTYSSTLDRAERQEVWWCLAAGARGVITYDVANYNWDGGTQPATITSHWFFANNLKNIITAYTSWTGWNKLLPDLSSALVTAGRGTRATGFTSGGSGGAYEPAFTNNWVAASKTPDGSLAVCYLPAATTVTVTTSLLASGWAAWWIDPVTGASSSAGAGPTFNSTAKGANSQGDPDWVLVFRS